MHESLSRCRIFLKNHRPDTKVWGDCDPRAIALKQEHVSSQIAKCLACRAGIEKARGRRLISDINAHIALVRIDLAKDACEKALLHCAPQTR